MSFDDTINAYFVTTSTVENPDPSKCKDLETAFTHLRDHIPEENIRHIKASEGFPLIASGQLTKKDVFIFDKFEGDFFMQLKLTKSLIIGPRCLITCLLSSLPVPLGPSPIYTTAMRDLHICATGIAPDQKERVRTYIQWMGGYYFQNLSRPVTHLISNTIKSTKYEHASLNGIPVMHVDWVQRVWERSSVEDVSATDEEFEKYKLPIFFGTNITCTGLDTEKKNEIMRLVNENGGTYHCAFRSALVDIVITARGSTNSDKYKAAVKFKKEILCPEWIFDSAEKGFALPTKGYKVKSLKVSTPIKEDRSIADFTHLSDTSRISVMGGPGRNYRSELATVNDTISSGVNETQQNDNTFVAPVTRATTSKDLQREVHLKQGATEHYRLVYEEICPKQAKKAGNFLDGCCIYLSGFRLEEREKLNRILNVGGATRYDVVNEKITHIIVGQLDDGELRSWKRDGILTTVNIVRLDWLLQSIKLKQAASEIVYRMSLPTTREPDAPSPSSKKTLRSMNHSFKHPEKPKKKLFESEEKATESVTSQAKSTDLPLEEEEQHIIAQYSQENEPAAAVPVGTTAIKSNNNLADQTQSAPMASSTLKPLANIIPQPAANPSADNENSTKMNTEIDFDNLDFFDGKSLYIDRAHFPEEFYSQMLGECEAAHGDIVPATFVDIVDYAIVSFERTLNVHDLPVKARHIVTDLYVENCMKQNKLVPIEYFHRHVPHTANSQPLVGMTIVISTYTALEYDFIDSVAQLLGATVNRVLAKKERPLLVCPRAEGSKYEGAIKWGYPIVTSAWLVQCAVEGKKLSFQPYLVGNSPPDFPVSPTLREKNLPNPAARAPSNASVEPMDTQENAENDLALGVTAANEFTPLRNKRVTELAGSISRNSRPSSNLPTNNTPVTPDSPHTPTNSYGRSSCNFEYLEGVVAELDNEDARACLRELIEEMRNNQTPELERIRRQACTPINRKLPTPKGIPDFCTTPEFQKRMADALERRWRLPTKKLKIDTPIDELRRRVLRSTCEALGIPFTDTEETPTTSAKAAKKALAATAELSALAAQTPNTHLNPTRKSNDSKVESHQQLPGVVPRAIFTTGVNSNLNTSERRTTRVSDGDAFVPMTQSPTRGSSLGGEESRMVQQASFGKTTIDFDKITFENTETDTVTNVATQNIIAQDQSGSRSASGLATSSPELQKITEYLKNCESRRQSLKQSRRATGLGNASSGAASDSVETMVDNIDIDMPACGAVETETQHYVQPFESEQFGVGTENMVGWRDPVEFGKERRSKASPSMQYKGIPRFSISCVDEDARNDIINKIHTLGGTVSENLVNFDPDCTHFICERPNRGEKMLGCVSSGKWVLSLKYIEECYAKDVFVDEELYEWGNSKALNLPQLTPDEQLLASAVHRWRKKLNDTTSADGRKLGAFSGFRVILHIAERNSEAVKNVLRAGRGDVMTVQSPFNTCSAAKNATHCFVDVKKAPLTRSDYDYLRTLGVKIYSQMYINSYLMYGEEVDAAKYEIKIQ
ncbi:PREDICTED: DNA topoisomerase 2-binding protein 1-A [Rhagoletis zephyria]|uniref:DNA topoisomerase 2-binding protein 1-A n=1 Tax=Rhagoletis zephyria TaxID=28612 RepID=UPI0008112CC5|nr:PREDICTED: DNA topoisomerase 2-binding protein 1-A [Rhagoletis zephyria]